MNELKAIQNIICLKMKMCKKLWNRGKKIQQTIHLKLFPLELSFLGRAYTLLRLLCIESNFVIRKCASSRF